MSYLNFLVGAIFSADAGTRITTTIPLLLIGLPLSLPIPIAGPSGIGGTTA